MMRRLLLALAVACATAFGVKAAGPLDDYLMFETNGDDCYADGSPLWEGECYALVWRNGDAASREDGLFNADGTVVDSKATKILAVFPSAMQTNSEDTVYACARRSWTMISSMDMSRWENLGGVMSVFVFDTRQWNSGAQTWQLSECVVEDKSVASIRRYALVTDLEDIRKKQETGIGIFQWDTDHYGETFVTDPDGDLTMIGDMREFYSGTTNRTVGVSDELVVSFDARGGAPVPATMRTAGSACGELPEATGAPVGYAFGGWYTKPEGGNKVLPDAVVTEDVTFYAHWAPIKYTVQFSANGGAETMDPQEFVYDRPQALSACAFTRSGYGFVGWADGEDAVVAKYADGETVSNLTTVAGGTVPLFAVWSAGDNTVTFDAVGGTPSEASRTVKTDAQVGKLPTAARPGYALAGWYTAPAGGDEVTAETVVTEDVTYYAHWTPNEYSVDFNGREGAGDMPSQPMTYDEEVALYSNLFHRVGYTFLGWTDDEAELEEVLYADGVVVSNLTDEADGTVDLYAVWQANAYTVRFNANGGEGTMDPQGFVYDRPQALSACAFKRPGYGFAGWADGEDAVVAKYANGETVSNLTAEADGEATLFAVWTAGANTVTFDAVGGTPSEASRAVKTDAEVGKLPTAARTGYAFVGWFTAREGGDEVTDKTVVTEDVTYYAHWTPNAYSVVFDANGGEGEMSAQAMTYDKEETLSRNLFRRVGYTFAGWADGEGAVVAKYADGATVSNLTDEADGEVKLYAVWRTGQVWDGKVENDWLELSCRQDVVTLELGEEVVTDADHYFSANSGSEATLKVSGLPTGVKFDAKTGTMSGKATKAGVFYVTVAASNKSKYVQTRVMVMKVGGAEPDDRDEIGLNRAALSSLVVGTVLPSGLVTIPSGASASGLPKGLKVVKAGAVDATGAVCDSIEGVPTKGGKYTIKVTAKNPTRAALLNVIVADPGSKYVAVAAEGDGTATKSGVYAAGSTLKLAARAASKGSVFVGWKDEKGDRVLADGADARATTLSTVVGAATSARFTACFEPVALDVEHGVAVVPAADDWTFDEQEGPFEFLFRIDSDSLPKVSVKPIPSGFAFNGAKDIVIGADGEQYYRLVVKDAGKTKPGVYDLAFGVGNASVKQAFVKSLTLVVKNRRSGLYDLDYENPYQVSLGVNDASKYPAFAAPAGAKVSVSGLPSGLKYKDGKITGVATKTGAFTVTITTSSAAGKAVDTVFMSVDALPVSLVGTFNGVATNDDVLAAEKLTLTATDKGKITAKVGALSLTATGWDSLADGCARVRLEKAADVLDVCVNAGAWDALQVSGLYAGATEAFGLRAQRNPFGKAGKDYENPEAHELAVRLSRLGAKGKVPLSAAPDEKTAGVWNLSSRGEGAAQLTVQVKETGAVSLSGKLDKAHAASGSSVLTVDGELVTADFVLGKGEKKTVVRLVFGSDASGEIMISGTARTQPAE